LQDIRHWDLAGACRPMQPGSQLWILVKKKGEIRILNLADRKVTVLVLRNWKWKLLQFISWAADGRTLFASAESDSSFSLLSVDADGSPRILYEIPAGVGWIATIVPSPDGRSLAFTKRMYITDVMLLENF